METTTPSPWLDPAAETVPAFTPSGMAGRTDEAAVTARRLFAVEVVLIAIVTVAVLALIALAVAYFALRPGFKAAQDSLPRSPGRVLAVHASEGDGDSSSVDVRYGPDIDHLHRATISVGDSADYWPGQSVDVLRDRATGTVTLPGENYTPEWFESLAFWVVAAAVVIGGLALKTLSGISPLARALSRSPWRRVRARWAVAPIGTDKQSQAVLYVPAVAADRVFTVKSAHRFSGINGADGWGRIEVAGDRRGLSVRLLDATGRGAAASPRPWPVVTS